MGFSSGNPNEYNFAYNANNTKKISDKDVEAKVGLTREEIKELTHTFNGEYNYFKAGLIRDYLDTLPSLDKFELSRLLEEKVDRDFIDYAISIGYTSFDDLMLLKEVFEEANGATTQQVGAFTVELDPQPLPDELINAGLRASWYNGRTFNEFWAKGYSLDEIIALSRIRVTGSTINYFESVGFADADIILTVVQRYGVDIAKTMNEAGLSVMDLPFVEEVGRFELEQYVKAGIKGREDIARLSEHVNDKERTFYAHSGFKGADDTILEKRVNGSDANFYALAGFSGEVGTMLFLDDNNVSGMLAFVYSRKGITDKRAMVVLEKAGADEFAFANMQLFGFLDSKRFDYTLAELLVANSVYQQYKDLLKQALPDGVGGLPKIGLKDDEKRKLPLDYSRIPSYNRSNGLLEITE